MANPMVYNQLTSRGKKSACFFLQVYHDLMETLPDFFTSSSSKTNQCETKKKCLIGTRRKTNNKKIKVGLELGF